MSRTMLADLDYTLTTAARLVAGGAPAIRFDNEVKGMTQLICALFDLDPDPLDGDYLFVCRQLCGYHSAKETLRLIAGRREQLRAKATGASDGDSNE